MSDPTRHQFMPLFMLDHMLGLCQAHDQLPSFQCQDGAGRAVCLALAVQPPTSAPEQKLPLMTLQPRRGSCCCCHNQCHVCRLYLHCSSCMDSDFVTQSACTAWSIFLFLRFAAALLPRLFGKNPRSHHNGTPGRV